MKRVNESSIKDLVIEIAEKISEAYLERYGAYELNKHNAVDKDHLDQVAERILNHDELELYDNANTYIMEQIKEILEVDEVITDLKGWGERFEGPAFSRDHDLDVNLDLGEHPMPLDEKYLVPRLNEAYGRQRWSISKVEKEVLEPLAQELGVTLHKGNRKKQDTYAQKVTSQFYHIGDVPIMVRDVKVAGMGADDAEVWVLDKEKPSTGTKLNPMINYNGIEQKVKEQLGDTFTKPKERISDDPVEIERRVSEFIRGAEGNIPDDEAFDLARDFLEDDKPAMEYIRRDYADPVGWLANQI